MSIRHDLTARLIDLLWQDHIDLDTAMTAWWYDARPKGGLRLTDAGYSMFVQDLNLHQHVFHVDTCILKPRNLLQLDRYLTCPYYLRRRRGQYNIVLFGDQEAVMLNLYGDVERFISSLEP